MLGNQFPSMGARQVADQTWYRGNIHTHTTESDGDAEPEVVAAWYRDHGYDFLVLSDHNHLTLLDYGNGRNGSPGIGAGRGQGGADRH